MIDPSLAQARLFHAIVLMRLDSLEDAGRELTLIRGLEMPADVRHQVEDALRQIDRKRRRTNATFSVTTGWGYDRNRNAAPSSKNALVLDVPTPVEGTSRRRHDTAFIMIDSLDVTHDLGMQAGHELVGTFTYFLGEQTRVDDLDLQSFSLEPGIRLKSPWGNLTPRAIIDHVTLSRETYLRSQGGRVDYERAITPRLGVTGKTDWQREDFSGINESSAAAERRGSRITVDGGLSYLVIPSMQLVGSIAYDRKNAKATYYTYDGLTLSGTHTWILPKSQFILNTLELELNGYEGADPALSGTTRHDEIFRYRLTYGTPVATLVPLEALRPLIRDTTATASFEQTRSLSTVMNYTYANSKYTLLLTKTWEF